MADSLKSARRRAQTRSRLGFDQLEDRAVPAALTYVAPDANFDITNDVGPSGFSPGDTVTWNPGQPNQVAGLTAGTDAFDTIQSGVDNTDPGGTVSIAAGTYTENVTVSTPLTMLGAGDGANAAANTIIQSAAANTPVLTLATGGTSASARMDIEGIRVTGATGAEGNSTNGISINGGAGFTTLNNVAAVANAGNGIAINSAGSFQDIQILNSIVDSNAGVGIRIPSAAVNGFTIDSTQVTNNGFEGFATNPNGTANVAITNVAVTNSNFSGNNTNNDANTSTIDLFGFRGNATFTNDTIEHSAAGHALQIDGRNQPGPAGTIAFNGVTISGTPGKSGLIIQNFGTEDLSTKLSFNNVDLSGVTPGAGWAQLVIDQAGPGAVNLGNTKVTALGAGNPAAIAMAGPGGASAESVQFVDDSGNPVTNNFTIEDSITNGTDVPGLGLVTRVAGNVFVTPNTLGGIQQAINAAASGDTVNVQAGTYAENDTAIVIDHSINLLGPNAGITANGGTRVP
ncbi:MAG TPA: hypothetical protein VN641_16200 [Urbifossiella sp.]|nr:hypothetical protein [Urbifossiella sp.]